MLLLDWNKKYELGVEEIDLQHHYFVKLINRLAEEFSDRFDYEYCHSLLDELNAYARFHFISEENMMARAGYSRLAEHHEHHRQLLSELANMELELDMEASKENFAKILEFLVNWFLLHTTIEDRQFTDFINQP